MVSALFPTTRFPYYDNSVSLANCCDETADHVASIKTHAANSVAVGNLVTQRLKRTTVQMIENLPSLLVASVVRVQSLVRITSQNREIDSRSSRRIITSQAEESVA